MWHSWHHFHSGKFLSESNTCNLSIINWFLFLSFPDWKFMRLKTTNLIERGQHFWPMTWNYWKIYNLRLGWYCLTNDSFHNEIPFWWIYAHWQHSPLIFIAIDAFENCDNIHFILRCHFFSVGIFLVQSAGVELLSVVFEWHLLDFTCFGHLTKYVY